LVRGRLTPVPQLRGPGDYITIQFNPDPIIPAPFRKFPPEEGPRKEFEFWSSPAAHEYITSRRKTYAARFYPDGSFVSLERIPPGNYRLSAIFKNTSSSQKVTIVEGADAVLDLGEIHLQ